jgi:hypothetical protein
LGYPTRGGESINGILARAIVHDPVAKLPHLATPWLVICAQLLAEHAVSGVFAKFQETITAGAPADPNAALNDFGVPRVSANATLNCQE